MEIFEKLTSLEDVNKLKVKDLKEILIYFNQPVNGKKNDLVLRCCAVLDEKFQHQDSNRQALQDKGNLLNVPVQKEDITYEKIFNEIKDFDVTWTKDLRTLPEFHFVELYDYLVKKTAKYDHESVRTSGYKKLEAFQFFKEGHIKDLQVSSVGGLKYVKAEVLASMKQAKYFTVVVFDHQGHVLRAACKCPAGRGIDGCGQCNHVGSVLFAIEDFCRQGLREHGEAVSCTSKICKWNVPRNMKVPPKPVDDILFSRYRFGKETSCIPKNSLYDPRAPCDRLVNKDNLQSLCDNMASSVRRSSFFLFHKVKPANTKTSSVDIEIESYCESIPEVAVLPELQDNEESPDLPFNDDYDIKSKKFKSLIDAYVEKVSENEIQRIERITRGQSDNPAWRELKQNKLTASNFHSAAKRKAEPDKLLRSIMYLSTSRGMKPKASLQYGQIHENDAVECYVKAEIDSGNTGIRVWEVGTIICKERPGFGASLDRKVFDPLAMGPKVGGLEVKCPFSKRGQTPEEACRDPSFYMTIEKGKPKLKEGHRYYYQVQGQMYVCELQWVDFVVWLSGSTMMKERLGFNRDWWYNEALPRLDYFYKRAFLPEVLTHRVKRNIPLFKHGGWTSYKQYIKNARSD